MKIYNRSKKKKNQKEKLISLIFEFDSIRLDSHIKHACIY